MTAIDDVTKAPMVATWDELWARFDRALEALPDEVRDAAVDGLRPERVETAPPPPTERAVFEGVGDEAGLVYYAVQGSDLQALPEVGKALAVVVGGLMTAGFPFAAIMAMAANLTGLWWRLRKKQITLEMEQAMVLRALKRAPAPGWAVNELLAALDAGERLVVATADELRAVLESMRDVKRADGSRSRLVEEEGGVWRVVDV